jgi:hypothetical protein
LLRSPDCAIALLLAVTFLFPHTTSAYSVLTHEELIDLAWNDSIRPLLLARFPGTSEDELREAHAYAYGGSAIQDMGYYPFGKQFFSNLTHYVRSGDFVVWLLQNAQTPDELAFAIGALSHYYGDSIGHSEAINPATALEFPKLRHEFGPIVTYDESPHSHVRTEFAFDVEELSDAALAPPSYMRFIGFKVPRRFLERAFLSIYGFNIHELLGRAHPALRSYRTSVRSFIPAFAEAEIVLHRHQFPPHPDDQAYHDFTERVARTNYERKWRSYRGPGFKAHLLAIVVFIVPKIGPFSDLAIKIPSRETEELYLRSVNRTVDAFREALHQMAASDAPFALANIDLDTGYHAKLRAYPLADRTYSQLLDRLTSKPDRIIPEGLRQDIIGHYAGVGATTDRQKKTNAELQVLEKMIATDSAAGYGTSESGLSQPD